MIPILSVLAPVAAAAADAAAAGTAGAPPDLVHAMQRFVFELAAILIAARVGGLAFQRWLHLPAVIGELLAGVLIGPFALGSLSVGGLEPLFPRILDSMIQVSPEIYAIATVASLLLLFLSGLETDLGVFLRYFAAGSAVGLGGVVVSFAAGAWFACASGIAESWYTPSALFLGAISTATSVGITARILSEQRKTDSPEGVTILAAAVFDDVLGIIVLGVVLALAEAHNAGTTITWSRIGILALRAFGVWLGCTVVGILTAHRLSGALKRLGSHETIAAFAFGLALLLSGLVETAGLAMIIGAYIMGLSLSRTDLALVVRHQLQPAQSLLVPVFFCVMGMLIDLDALRAAFWTGLLFSLLAVAAKVVGCALPALAGRFNARGALRIGVGMVPRGEVALIIAGIGLSTGSIGSSVFGVAVMMTVLTSVVAPPLLVRSFAGGSGIRKSDRALEELAHTQLEIGHPDLAEYLLRRVAALFRQEGFFVTPLSEDPPVYQIRKEQMVFTLRLESSLLILSSPAAYADIGRFVVLEEVLAMKDITESLKKMERADSMSGTLAGTLFEPE